MRNWPAGRWLALGAACVVVSGCEAADRRLDQFSELVDSVYEQISTEILGNPPANPLTAVPVDARALSGRWIAFAILLNGTEDRPALARRPSLAAMRADVSALLAAH